LASLDRQLRRYGALCFHAKGEANMKKEVETLRDFVSFPLDDELSHKAFTEGYLKGWNASMSLMYCLSLGGASSAETYYTALYHWNRLHDSIAEGFDILDINKHTFTETPYKGIRFKKGFIYILRADNGVYKIGQTTQLDDRIKQLGIQLPYELELVHAVGTDHVLSAEQLLHKRYASKRQKGEWFALSDEDIEEIKGLNYLHTASGEHFALWFAGWKNYRQGEQEDHEPKQNQG